MCVTTSRYEISGKNSHLLSRKVFLRSTIYPSEKTIHWNKQYFGMRYPPPFFLHYVSTIKHNWSIEHCLLLLLFLTLFLHYFCFCSFLIIKKTVHGPGPWQGVHGPGPWKWSMDPVQSGGPWTPGPCFVLTLDGSVHVPFSFVFEGQLAAVMRCNRVKFLLIN